MDLSSYLAGSPQVGDFKFFTREDGGSELVQAESRSDTKNTVTVTFAYTEEGKTHHDIEEQVAGRELRQGTSWDDTLEFAIPHPQRVERYSFVPGRPQKFKVSATVFYLGTRVAKSTTVGATTFVGFEQVTTPLGTFDQAAHFTTAASETIRTKGQPDFVIVSSSDSWLSKEYGSVQATRESSSYENGLLQSSFGPHRYVFDHGVLQGTAVPVPAP